MSIFERRLTIVMFHRVLPAPDPLRPHEADVELFRRRVSWLRDTFELLTLREAFRRLEAGDLPPRSLVITFDDGYADNAELALPVLESLGAPATFFVTTRYLDGGMMWNDRVIEAIRQWPDETLDLELDGVEPIPLAGDRALAAVRALESLKYLAFDERDRACDALLARSGASPADLMMHTGQLRELRDAGMEIGAHTHSHPIMARMPLDEVRAEIEANKARLEEAIGETVTSFAYPNGRAGEDYLPEHCGLLREIGFECAVTTMPGCAADDSHPFEIPRFSPWDRTRARYLARLGLNYLRKPEYAPAA